ncbi:MAG: hypothetical protein IT430_12105 [Phycisphaerales bacterium]|nr:hypothetical protein [Phycisphaerales bacterium]
MIHVAILYETYLRAILDGRKTVEIRLTMTNRAPFEAIEAGERLYLKRSGGPFRATAIAEHVMFMRDLSPGDIDRIRRDYNEWIGADGAAWSARKQARYGTLIWLRDVEAIRFGPRMKPHHGVAWQCLPEREDVYPACLEELLHAPAESTGASSAAHEMVIPLTAANIRHGHVYLTGLTDRFPAASLGGRTRAEAGMPLTLRFARGATVHTDIVRHRNIFRSRAWRAWFAQHGAREGDRVCLRPRGAGEFDVTLLRRAGGRD